MSTRYVWDKWNTKFTENRVSVGRGYESNWFPGERDTSALIFYSSSYEIDPDGRVKLVNPEGKILELGRTFYFDAKTYFDYIFKIEDFSTNYKYYFENKKYNLGTHVRYLPTRDYISSSYHSDDSDKLEVPAGQEVRVNRVKGDSHLGKVTGGVSNAYPSNGFSGNNWYVSAGNDNVDPERVDIPASANGNEPLPVTVTPRAPVHGGTIAYKYEYSVDGGGSWVSAGDATTATTKRIAIPAGTQTMRVRVRAQDNLGFVSTDYVAASQTAAVEWNQPPVLSGEDRDLGTLGMDKPAPYAYTVTDADGDAVTVTEAIDGVPFKTHQPPLGVQQTCTVPDETWLGVLNGRHTLTIAATDGKISGGGRNAP